MKVTKLDGSSLEHAIASASQHLTKGRYTSDGVVIDSSLRSAACLARLFVTFSSLSEALLVKAECGCQRAQEKAEDLSTKYGESVETSWAKVD